MASDKHGDLHQVPRGDNAALEDLRSGNITLHYATQTRKPRFGYQKISVTTSSITSGHLTPQIAITLIIICGLQLGKRPTKLHAIPKMN